MFKIIICSLLLFSTKILSQDVSTLVNYEMQYLVAKNDTAKNNVLIEKFNYCLRNQLIDSTTFELGKRIKQNFIKNKDILNHFLWNMALISLINKELNFAKNYESNYVKVSEDTSIHIQLLKFFIYKDNKELRKIFVNNLIQFDSLFIGLNCLDSLSIEEKESSKLVKYSKIIPGLGTYLLGNKIKGITSFALTGVSTYAVFELLRHNLYINAIGFSLVYWLKFYQGNSILTEELIHDKLNKKRNGLAVNCETVYSEILNAYPLNFKY